MVAKGNESLKKIVETIVKPICFCAFRKLLRFQIKFPHVVLFSLGRVIMMTSLNAVEKRCFYLLI